MVRKTTNTFDSAITATTSMTGWRLLMAHPNHHMNAYCFETPVPGEGLGSLVYLYITYASHGQ